MVGRMDRGASELTAKCRISAGRSTNYCDVVGWLINGRRVLLPSIVQLWWVVGPEGNAEDDS